MKPKFESDLDSAVFTKYKVKIKEQYIGLLNDIWARTKPENHTLFHARRYKLSKVLDDHYRVLNMRVFDTSLVNKAQKRVDDAVKSIMILNK